MIKKKDLVTKPVRFEKENESVTKDWEDEKLQEAIEDEEETEEWEKEKDED